jgi:SAM-dependent methyltransferase
MIDQQAKPQKGLQDLEQEVQISRSLASRDVRQFLATVGVVSEAFLAQVLVALWDSGFYEYVRQHDRIEAEACCRELALDPAIFQSLFGYLVGRGIFQPHDGAFVLSEKGRPYWNYVTRGVLTAHVGGYNQLLVHLGPLLRGEMSLDDPRLDRDGRLVGVGANYTLLGSGTVPWVLRIINELGGKYVMDIGCGGGLFLIHLALKWPFGSGIGTDMDAASIAAARKNAQDFGVADRVTFQQAKLSPEPMNIPRQTLDKVDVLTAMYVLHEFGGRGGPQLISDVIGWLKRQFPGRKLLLAEGTPADPLALCENPPPTYAQLDYSFFHPLSRQGPLRTPDQWKQIIENAGARLIERVPGFGSVPAWISLYIVGLD